MPKTKSFTKSSAADIREDATRDTDDTLVSKSEDSLKVDVPTPKYDAEHIDKEGTILKTEKVANLITDSYAQGGNSGMGITAAGTRASSGTSGYNLGNTARTPIGEETRTGAKGRFDKKAEKIATNINYQPSERFIYEVKGSKALNENPGQTVGYNGTPKTTLLREAKKTGATPANSEYSRSLDYLERDMLYFSQGQTIKKNGDNSNYTPTVSAVYADGVYKYQPGQGNITLPTSNFIHTQMNVLYDDEANLVGMNFDVTELPVDVDDNNDTINCSASNLYTAVNAAEIDREVMDQKAGDPTQPGWSPIPRSIPQADEVIFAAKDLEAIAGSELYMCQKKFELSCAHQLNKATKDGMQQVRPANEWMEAGYNAVADQTTYEDNVIHTFDSSKYAEGSAAIFIDAYDSKAKYNKKSDFLLQPRSVRMHMPSLMNAIKAFKIDPRFVKTYLNREAYSTIDGSYDPSKPIMLTDKAALIHRHNFNDLLQVVTVSGEVTLTTSANSDDHVTRTVKLADNYLTSNAHKLYYLADAGVVGTFSIAGSNLFMNINNSKTNKTIKFKISATDPSTQLETWTVAQINGVDVTQVGKYNLIIGGNFAHNGVDSSKFVGVKECMRNLPKYAYSDYRTTYMTELRCSFLEGIAHQLGGNMNGKFAKLIGKAIWHVPMKHTVEGLSTWDLIIATSANEMVLDRKLSMVDFIEYESNFGNPFSGLVKVEEVLSEPYKNFSVAGIDSPVIVGAMDEKELRSWQFPEMLWQVGQTDNYKISATAYVKGTDTWASSLNIKIGDITAEMNGMNIFYKIVQAAGATAPSITLSYSATGNANIAIANESYSAFELHLLVSNETTVSGYTSFDSPIPKKSIGNKIQLTSGQAAKGGVPQVVFDGVTATYDVVLPMYENELNYYFDTEDSAVKRNWEHYNTSYPNLRQCSTIKPLADIYTEDERDYRLDIDRITNFAPSTLESYLPYCCGYKYAFQDEGLIMFTFSKKLTVAEFLSLPRELGWSIVAPGRSLTPAHGYKKVDLSRNVLGSTSYRYKVYRNATMTSEAELLEGLNPLQTRASVFIQYWSDIQNINGDPAGSAYNVFYSMAQAYSADGELVENKAIFVPFSDIDDGTQVTGTKAHSLENYAAILFSRINVVPFVINPFDALQQESGKSIPYDIYEFAQMFGLCGFKASDYTEDLYNRILEADNLGRKYVLDNWFVDSRFSK